MPQPPPTPSLTLWEGVDAGGSGFSVAPGLCSPQGCPARQRRGAEQFKHPLGAAAGTGRLGTDSLRSSPSSEDK